MELIITRHGETDYNRWHLHDHLGKAMLTDDGKHRAEVIAQLNKKIDAIYSSPLQRCIDTIAPLCEARNMTPIIDERLTEIRLDCMQDESWKDVPAEFNQKLHDVTAEPTPGCEHMSEVRKRLASFFQELYTKYPQGNIVISSHAGTIINMGIIFGEKAENSLKSLPNNTSLEFDKIFKIIEVTDEKIKNMEKYIHKNP